VGTVDTVVLVLGAQWVAAVLLHRLIDEPPLWPLPKQDVEPLLVVVATQLGPLHQAAPPLLLLLLPLLLLVLLLLRPSGKQHCAKVAANLL
jgi:hypothetical protein